MSSPGNALLPHTCPGPQHVSVGAGVGAQAVADAHVSPRKSGPPAGEPDTTVFDSACTQSYWQDMTFVSKSISHAANVEPPANWHL